MIQRHAQNVMVREDQRAHQMELECKQTAEGDASPMNHPPTKSSGTFSIPANSANTNCK